MGVLKRISAAMAAAILALLVVCILSPPARIAIQARATAISDQAWPLVEPASEAEWWAAKAQACRASLAAFVSRAWVETGDWQMAARNACAQAWERMQSFDFGDWLMAARNACAQAWERMQSFDFGAHSASWWTAASQAAAKAAEAAADRKSVQEIAGRAFVEGPHYAGRALTAVVETWEAVVGAAGHAWDAEAGWRQWQPVAGSLGLAIFGAMVCLSYASRRSQRRVATNAVKNSDNNDCSDAAHQLEHAAPAGRSFPQRRSRVASPPPRPERTAERAPLSDISSQIAGETRATAPDQPLSENDVLAMLNSDDPMRLKGVGPLSAAKIIKYRRSQGDLAGVDDLVSKVGMTRAVLMSVKRQQGIL